MINKIIRALATASEFTTEEILDVLWLISLRPTSQSEEPRETAEEPGNNETHNRPATPPAPRAKSSERDSLLSSEKQFDRVPIWLDTNGKSRDTFENDTEDRTFNNQDFDKSNREHSSEAQRQTSARQITIGSPDFIRDALSFPRSLRHFRQIRIPGHDLEIDIDATVEATAEAGCLAPQFASPQERGLDLVLVVDASAQMQIWTNTFDEFERLLAQTGAFRSVSRWWLVPDQEQAFLKDSVTGFIQSPRRLVDPSGRRVILIATDTGHGSWHTRGPWDAIATWCAAMPTALIQVLPPRYWSATATGHPSVTMRARRPAAPNAEYTHRPAWWSRSPQNGPPLPVLTLTPDALSTWAQAAVGTTAWASGTMAAPPDPDDNPHARDIDGATALVNDFFSLASPGGEQVARILANAASLSLPLISMLQEQMAPGTGVSELAEVMASGLLEESWSSASSDPVFQYRPGTREILQQGVTAFEEWDAYAVVSRYIGERQRRTGLQALIPDESGSVQLDPSDKPFADLERVLAVRLGLRSAPTESTTAEFADDTTITEETLLRAEISTALSRNDYRSAARTAGELIDLYLSADRPVDALHLADQAVSYTAEANLGPWTRALAEIRLLYAQITAGDINDPLSRLLEIQSALDNLDPTPSTHEITEPSFVYEKLLIAKRDAAFLLGRWHDALDFNADVIASMQDREADGLDIMKTRFADYGALLSVNDAEAARDLLLDCLTAFKGAEDIEFIAKANSALAYVQSSLGAGYSAIQYAREALRYSYLAGNYSEISIAYSSIGSYISTHTHHPSAAFAYRIAAALIRALIGADFEALALSAANNLREFSDSDDSPENFSDLCHAVDAPPDISLSMVVSRLSPSMEASERTLQAILRKVRDAI